MIYTGIGSREVPEEIQFLMRRIAKAFAFLGFQLYSGGATGSDTAFEEGCDEVDGDKCIFYSGHYINNNSKLCYEQPVLDAAELLAMSYHPAWGRLNRVGRALQTRNGFQVFGADLQSPTELLICWTQDGEASGGTGQAVRIATDANILVYNLFKPEDREIILKVIETKIFLKISREPRDNKA